MQLIINYDDTTRILSKENRQTFYFIKCLSSIFNVSYAKIVDHNDERCFYFILNNKKFCVDTSDHSKNLLEIIKTCQINGVEIILKIQSMNTKYWKGLSNKCGVKIIPWSMFPKWEFPLGSFNYESSTKELTALVSGRMKWGREKWAIKAGDSFVTNKLSFDQYIASIKKCKWGLILSGSRAENCDCKNRREVEYSSMGFPLAMNYIPSYSYELRPNVDFLYLEKPEDLSNLTKIDPTDYAIASKKLWNKVFSPQAMADMIIDLI